MNEPRAPGISSTQARGYRVMRLVAQSGIQGISVAQIARAEGVSPQVACRDVATLESAGMIQRVAHNPEFVTSGPGMLTMYQQFAGALLDQCKQVFQTVSALSLNRVETLPQTAEHQDIF